MAELIDRHALLKKVYEHPQERERMTDGEWCRKCIHEAPKVESESVRHGQWLGNGFCSECNRFPVKAGCGISNRDIVEYFEICPHCGAVMRKSGVGNG